MSGQRDRLPGRLPQWLNDDGGLGDFGKGLDFGSGTASEPVFAQKAVDSLKGLLRRVHEAEAEGPASNNGFLQTAEPAVRVVWTVSLISAAALCSSWAMLALAGASVVVFAGLCGVPLSRIARRTVVAAATGLVILLPYVLASGLSAVDGQSDGPWSSGLASRASVAAFLEARIVVMAATASVFAMTTRRADLYSALARLPVPSAAASSIFIADMYLSTLARTAQDAMDGARSRIFHETGFVSAMQAFATKAAVVMNAAIKTADDLGLAMRSRGFSGALAIGAYGGATRPLKAGDYALMAHGFFLLFLSFAF